MQGTVRTRLWNAFDAPHLDLREFLERAESQNKLPHIHGAAEIASLCSIRASRAAPPPTRAR